MGEKGNMIDTGGLDEIGSGAVPAGGVPGGIVGGGAGSSHHTAGIVGSVAKAAGDHAEGDESASKHGGLAGLLPSAQPEKPPADR